MAYTTVDNPSEHFQPVLFTGSTSNITVDIDMRPDLFWFKSLTQTYSHLLDDTSRPADGTSMPTGDVNMYASLSTNNTDDELDNNADGLVQTSTGFIVDGDGQAIGEANQGADNMAAYCWKANGGTTTTNAAGANGADHESVFQANDTAGFSIVTYTSDAAAGDTIIKHGLSTAPTFMVHKARNADNTIWWTYHKDLTDDGYMHLESTNTNQDGSTNVWRNTAPTSSVFKVGLNSIANADGRTMVAYCFSEIKGYSKFGKYESNGTSNGAFVYLGFKPAFVIVKSSTKSSQSWHMLTGKIGTGTNSNPLTDAIDTNQNIAKRGTFTTDFLSTGFKIRHTSGGTGTADETYIYMAWAESPFVSSTGTPTTAR